MEDKLRQIVTAALQECRQHGCMADVLQLAYTACLLEEQGSWGPHPAPTAAAAAVQPPEQQGTQQQQDGLTRLTLSCSEKLSDAAVALLVQRLVQEVSEPADPAAAATATLQVTLARAFQEQQTCVEAEQAASAAEAARLAASVAYRKVQLQTAGLADYQQVFEGVVDYVAAAIGVGAKVYADAVARATVAAAVESAFPLADIAHFLTLPAAARMQQMEALAHVTCGICLYNDSNLGSALMPPGPAAQLQHAHHLLAAIEAAAATAEQAMAHFNSCRSGCSSGSSNSSGGSSSGSSGSSGSGGSNCDGSTRESVQAGMLVGAALFCCQAVVVMSQLAADLAAGISCCQALQDGLEATMIQVSRHVGSSTAAVPKEAVFPLFESAGQMHLALTGELRLLLVRDRLWEATTAALSAAAATSPAVPRVLGFKGRLGSSSSSSGSGSIRWVAGGMAAAAAAATVLSESEVAELPADMEYLSAAAVANGFVTGDVSSSSGSASAGGGTTSLALAGFCPVSLAGSVAAAPAAGMSGPGSAAGGGGGGGGDGGPGVQQAAVLVGRLAQQSVGFVRYQGALYGFCSPAALRTFTEAPALTLDGVWQAVHRVPLLAHLLGLTGVTGMTGVTAVPGASTANAGPRCAVLPLHHLMQLLAAPIKVDAGTQTPTHFTDRHIDVDYEWNEWALRLRIIALANLRNKATHSAQTLLSHFRKDGDSQTWSLKAAAVQTQVNKGSSMPRKLRYVTGLRGPPATTTMKVVSLELDIGQTHQH